MTQLRVKFSLIFALATLISSVAARLISVGREYDQDSAAASDHHYGRVHIKVFRGPGHEHHFAPHGYWVKQPADDHHDGN